MHDRAKLPRGFVRYEVWQRGLLVERVTGQNLVVTSGQSILAAGIGGNAAGGVITQFGVGTNISSPVAGNTMLTGQFAKALDGVAYPEAGEVAFAFSLQPGDANGVAISEFGLLTASGALFARKVRQAPLAKTSDVTITGTWTISW